MTVRCRRKKCLAGIGILCYYVAMAKYTKLAIINTFWELMKSKPLGKITVQDVVKKCDMNRNTFYYYFENVYDILSKILNTEIDQLLLSSDTNGKSFCEWVYFFIEYAVNNKKIMKNLYHSLSREEFDKYIHLILFKIIRYYFVELSPKRVIPESELAGFAEFLVAEFLGILLNWILNDMNEDIEKTMKNVSGYVDCSIDMFLSKYPLADNPSENN